MEDGSKSLKKIPGRMFGEIFGEVPGKEPRAILGRILEEVPGIVSGKNNEKFSSEENLETKPIQKHRKMFFLKFCQISVEDFRDTYVKIKEDVSRKIPVGSFIRNLRRFIRYKENFRRNLLKNSEKYLRRCSERNSF